MDLSVKEVVEGILSKEAAEKPADDVKPENLVLELPEWYDEKKFNQARRFFWDNCFAFTTVLLPGLVAVFTVPSILRVLINSHRSSSVYTAYKRYMSTLLHTVAWNKYELKPGSISWKSLHTVRLRHLRATLAGKLHGKGIVSQRDVALTQFGFFGFSLLKPDKIGIRQLQEGDWEAHIHFWRVIGHMIGLEDRYNICRNTVEESREVCQELLDRVFTPCLENMPEYCEHMSRVMLEGMTYIVPTLNIDAAVYWTRYLANVPGYIYTEADRIDIQRRLKEQIKGKSIDTGVDVTCLISKPAVDGLPELPPRVLYVREYETINNAPPYKQLTFKQKFHLNMACLTVTLYATYLGRCYFNFVFYFHMLIKKYFPYMSFFRFGVKESYVNMFVEDPTDDTVPKPNSEYYKSAPPVPWYLSWLPAYW